MKAVILAGGFGTRISEETQLKPKPMIEIGGKPILLISTCAAGTSEHHGPNPPPSSKTPPLATSAREPDP